MKEKLVIQFLLFILATVSCAAQEKNYFQNNYGYQYGLSVKASVEFAEKFRPAIRFGVSGGIGRSVICDNIYPSLHLECMFYHNGFGSTQARSNQPFINADLILSGTVTFGGNDRFTQLAKDNPTIRRYPLYYMANFSRPPLENPFHSSGSVGSNLVFSPTHKKSSRVQQVGFINVHVGQFQFSYFNDGTPCHYAALGDGHDRFYTGGGTVTFSLDNYHAIDQLEFGYYKYTGFTRNAFEIANLLDFSFLNYAENNQNYYNKSMFSFRAGSSKHRSEFSFSALNQTNADIQHVIHRYIFNAYHRVPHQEYMTPGFSTYYSTLHLGMK